MLGLEAVVLRVVVLKFRQGFEFGQGVQSAELGLFLEPLSKFGAGIEFEGCAEAGEFEVDGRTFSGVL